MSAKEQSVLHSTLYSKNGLETLYPRSRFETIFALAGRVSMSSCTRCNVWQRRDDVRRETQTLRRNSVSLRHRLPCEYRRHLLRNCACWRTPYHALRKRVSVTMDILLGFSSPLLYLLRPLFTDSQPPRLVLRHKVHTSPTLERGLGAHGAQSWGMRELVQSWRYRLEM